MPYFLLVVDYQSATTVADKVALLVGAYSQHVCDVHGHLRVWAGSRLECWRLRYTTGFAPAAPSTVRVATGIGLLWSVVLVACGMVFTYGMTTVVALAKTDPAQAQAAWQAIEPVALGLGGAGGEVLGGLWVLLVSWVALRSGALPKVLGWLGLVIGVAGLISTVPPLQRGRLSVRAAADRVVRVGGRGTRGDEGGCDCGRAA